MPYKDKKRKKKNLKDWLERNPHKIKEYNEKYKEKHKIWREKNKEILKIKIKKWRQKNMERDLALKRLYYKNNKERHNKLGKERLLKRKLLVFTTYSKNPPECACCGEKEFLFLSIDHINGGGNKHRKMTGGTGGDHTYRWLVKNNFPEGFQVLCYNCNQAKGHYGQCPHKNKK